MPIQPFKDRPKVDISKKFNTSVTPTSGTLSSGDLHAHSQGVSVNTFVDTTRSLIPFLSSNGFPTAARERIDFSIDQTTFGVVRLFEDSDNEIDMLAFNDIATLNDPVKFLNDTGITAYPQVMLEPGWLNPGAMNGIIEPLDVRGTLPGASIDSPFVAHSIKSSMATGKQGEIFQYQYHEGVFSKEFNKNTVYIDSQDVRMSGIGVDGISDFLPEKVAPFDDYQENILIKNDLKVQNISIFNDFIGIGLISKGVSNTMFNYEVGRSVSRGETGIRNVSGVESLAFGGMTR